MANSDELTRWQRGQRRMIGEALTTTRGNVTHAAKWLGISPTTLRDKARRFDLDIASFIPPGVEHRGRNKLHRA